MLQRLTALGLILAGCQSAVIRVERSESGAIERDLDFEPVKGIDGHYISLPPEPLVNCIDALLADGAAHDGLDKEFCTTSGAVRGYLGFSEALGERDHVSWINAASLADDARARAALAQLGGTGAAVAVASFLHFSDVQIREPQSKLGGEQVSHTLDPLVQSFERDYEQELYSGFMYEAFVATVNREVELPADAERPRPRLMIHTGDSVDSGLASEFERFRRYSNQFEMPWYQVVGNHDVLAFGNLGLHSDREPDPGGFAGDTCGPSWKACTCTRLSDLVREEMIVDRPPDNCGVPAKVDIKTAALPLVLQRVCIDQHVKGDRLVMTPDRYPNSVNAFIAAHCERASDNKCLAVAPIQAKVDAAEPPASKQVGYASRIPAKQLCATVDDKDPSQQHGFDLVSLSEGKGAADELLDESRTNPDATASSPPYVGNDKNLKADDEARQKAKRAAIGGYYCFQLAAPQVDEAKKRIVPGVWAVVLNTSNDAGAYGEVSAEEYTWLQKVLGKDNTQFAGDDAVLVFGHHPIYDVFAKTRRYQITDLLTGDPHVVAYFAGHLHRAETRLLHPTQDRVKQSAPAHHVLEILAPAVISWPQQARQVTIKKLGDVGYFEILSFTPHGTGQGAELVSRATRGAERDRCGESPSSCRSGHAILTSQGTAFSRLFFRWPKSAPHTVPAALVDKDGETRCTPGEPR